MKRIISRSKSVLVQSIFAFLVTIIPLSSQAYNYELVDGGPWMGRSAQQLSGYYVSGAVTPYIVDWDDDGDLDLLTGESSGRINLVANEGDGKYADPVEFVDIGGSGNTSMAVTDWDNDGDKDIIVGSGNDNIRLFLNDGDDSFTADFSFETDIGSIDDSYPDFVDWDHDGDLDVISGSADGDVHLYTNDGSGGMSFDSVIATHGTNISPRAVDWDNDGDWDLIAGDFFGTLTYFENDGSDVFTVTPSFSGISGSAYAAPAIADLNGDGLPDVIVGGVNGELSVYFHDASGGLVTEYDRSEAYDNLIGTTLPSVVDWNDDGNLDVVLFSSLNSTTQLLLNQGDGSFVTSTIYDDGVIMPRPDVPTRRAGTAVDWDSDGDQDLIYLVYEEVTDASGGGSGSASLIKMIKLGPTIPTYYLSLEMNDGTDNFISNLHFGNIVLTFDQYSGKISTVDWDNDGDLDILIGLKNGTIDLFTDNGDDTFSLTTGLGGIDVGDTAGVSARDWDGDGDTDIIAGNAKGHINLYLNRGNDTFVTLENVVDYDAGAGATPYVVDFNGDGFLDAVVGFDSGRVSLLLGKDADGDGFLATDCKDDVASINPAATDVCGDGIDQNCNGTDATCATATSPETDPGTDSGTSLEPVGEDDGATPSSSASGGSGGGGCSLSRANEGQSATCGALMTLLPLALVVAKRRKIGRA